MRWIFHLLLAGLLLSSCTFKKVELPEPPAPINQSHCDSVAATFSGKVNPIIQAKCAIPGCHVAGTGVPGNFSSYSGVKQKVDNGSFENRTITLKDMPPAGPLPANEIDILKCWLSDGAKNN
jgi:hypothetical protein